MSVLEAQGLGKRYGRTWALHECNLRVPEGHVVGLVGPNGAGKSTLLHLAVGLAVPTEGTITVGDDLVPGSEAALDAIGFVAQDSPLYPGLSVDDTLRLVRSLSRGFDEANARGRLDHLGIPLDRKVGRLSGGQHSQVALAVALARRPKLLLLDEPLARLDPLARHEFLGVLMSAVEEDGLSIFFSTHVVSEMDRICDYLVVLAQGRVQVAGDVETLLDGHVVLSGPAASAATVMAQLSVVRADDTGRVATLLVRGPAPAGLPEGWRVESTNLEELILTYLREPDAEVLPGPSAVAHSKRASA